MRTVQFMGVGMCAIVAMLGVGTSVVSQVPPLAPIDDEISRRADYLRNQGLGDAGAAQAEAVLRECALLKDHPWAGEYYCGDGTGMNVCILIAPENGVVYTWHGCLGLYDWNRGTVVSANDDRIQLELELPPNGSFTGYLSPTLYRVQWGGRHYLVPEGQMQSFCEDARRRAWPFDGGRSSQYPLRESEQEAELEGDPSIPPPYDRLMLPEPIRGTVVGVGEPERYFDTRWERDMWRVRLVIDRGSDSGLFEGLTLFPPGAEWHANAAVVTELTDATGVLWIESTANRPSVEIGTVYSSRPMPKLP